MAENPYQAPAQPQPASGQQVGSTSITGGLICIVLAGLGLANGGMEGPPNPAPDPLDDLPYMAGKLFGYAAIVIVGVYLIVSGYRARRRAAT